MPSKIKDAAAIAKRDLRTCYAERGILSGSRMVYWSWDSFFASFGALCLGDTDIVRRNLELYLQYQKPNGAIPKRIANPFYYLRFVGIPVRETPRSQRPTFFTAYFTAASITQNATLPFAFHAYYMASGDRGFLAQHYDRLERCFEYLRSKEDRRGLLKEGLGGGWAESVLKRGAITFTNVCYARSLQCMEELSREMGFPEKGIRYAERAKKLKKTINDVLWHQNGGGYYSDWLGLSRHHHFAIDGNLLAILWDIATPKQIACIQEKVEEMMLEDDVPVRLAYDKYLFWRIFIFNWIGGMKNYHVGFSWTWLGCIDVLVKLKLGRRKEALEILERISEVIVRDDTVHEIYFNGKPVHTFFYTSEHPWAWASGMFVYTCKEAGLLE